MQDNMIEKLINFNEYVYKEGDLTDNLSFALEGEFLITKKFFYQKEDILNDNKLK